MVGGEICRILRARGSAVRGLVRPGSPRTEQLGRLGVECVVGDLKSPDSLRAACRGVRAVVSTANSALSRRTGDSIRTVDLQGQLDLVAAARAEGVARFVHVSVSPSVSASSPFVRAKRRVEEAVRGSGMAWTVLQPSPFMEIAFSKVAGWDLRAGVIAVLGRGTMPVTYISSRDVAAVAALQLEGSSRESRFLPLGGPRAVTPLEAVKVFESALGRPLRVRHVPLPAVHVLSRVLTPFDPVGPSLMRMAAETAARGDVQTTDSVWSELPVARTTIEAYARHVAEGGAP